VPEYYGSGVVIDESGLILTNYHVVRDATKVYVRLPGKAGSYADIFAADPRSDLAVLKLITPPGRLKAVTIGDGSKARKGDWVIALANPYAAGFRDGSPTASWGIIGNVRRRAPGASGADSELEMNKTLHHYGTLLQTDARLNLGCSGGALINLDGELIGITTALAALTGGEGAGGYAVPMDANLRRVVAVLKRGEEVEYGFLGVTAGGPGPSGRGVTVQAVTPGSPAAKAGLSGHDTILSVNDIPVHDRDDLFLNIGAALAGNEARLQVESADGPNNTIQTRAVKATLAKFYYPGGAPIAAVRPEPVHGLRVEYASVVYQKERTGFDRRPPAEMPEGVMVRDVAPNSPADRVLKSTGLLITRVNGQPVRSPAQFYQEARKAKGAIELTVVDPSNPSVAPRIEKLP
jgi:serine protease Do